MSPLSWRHHTLIQALLSRGPLNEKDFQSVFSGVIDNNPSKHLFSDYLLKINKELALIQFELRACRNQYDGNIYYGVVNNVGDEQSKLGTKYTASQIAFFKGIIEAIANDATAQGSISNINALNVRLENQVPNGASGSQSQDVPPAFKNFSMSQKEKTLEELVRDQWLCSTPDNSIGLGLRSFLDLRAWFRANDIPACEVCNEAGIKAVLCRNEGCSVRMHMYCLDTIFSQRKVDKVCPGCGTPWIHSVAMAEPIEEDVKPGGSSQNLAPPRPPTKKRLRSCRDVDSEPHGSGSSQALTSTVDTRRTLRSSLRR